MSVTPRAGETRAQNLSEDKPRLQRKRGINTDNFHVPENLKNAEMSYEWKTATVTGKAETTHQVMLAENHWQPVQAEDMPGMMPSGYSGAIERGGQILMCRPAYLTQEAQDEILDMSRQRVITQERRLGVTKQGELPRDTPRVSKEVAPVTRADRASVRTIPD